jgi:hypothetical protein
MGKLLNVYGLSEARGIPVRTLRSFVAAKKIPFFKCGHRTILFDLAKVDAALARYEVKEVGVAK